MGWLNRASWPAVLWRRLAMGLATLGRQLASESAAGLATLGRLLVSESAALSRCTPFARLTGKLKDRPAAILAGTCLKSLRSRWIRGVRLSFIELSRPDTAPGVLGALLFACAFLAINPMAGPEPPYSTAVYAAGGELLGAVVAADGQWRLPMPSGGDLLVSGAELNREQVPQRFAQDRKSVV